jgi:hypothetical protein
MSLAQPIKKIFIAFLVCLLCACESAVIRAEPETVTVTKTDLAEGMTPEQLDSEVRRFAQRYIARVTQFYEETKAGENLTSKQRRHIIDYQLESSTAAVSIAVGENPVTNLLDMMVLATLSRMESESPSALEFYGEERAAVLAGVAGELERDIWNISGNVLTEQQQAQLRALIDAQVETNPDFSYFFRTRFSGFSGVEADGLGEVQRTGGLLSSFNRTLDEVEQVRLLSERLMFRLDFAQYLAGMRAEQVFDDLMQQPELKQTMDSTNRFALAIEGLPDERFAAIDQVLAGIAQERKALIKDFVDQQSTIHQTLRESRPVLESASVLAAHLNEITKTLERTATKVNLDLGGEGEPVDIVAYQKLIAESAATAKELRLLSESLARTEILNQNVVPAFGEFQGHIDDVIYRLFFMMIATIVVFFLALYLYRRATQGYQRSQDQ